MATMTRSRARNGMKRYKLPNQVTKQLASIYYQSGRSIKKHPYKTATSVLLSLGIASGSYFLIRYLTGK